MELRGTLSKDWVSVLPNVISKLNNTPLKRLGNLRPNDIHGMEDSFQVFELKKKLNIPTSKEPSFDQQQNNQKLYFSNEKNILREDVYCYVDFNASVFDKAYDVSVFTDLQREFVHFFFLFYFKRYLKYLGSF